MKTTLLTRENAHRVTMVRRVDAPESEPVAFHFKGKRYGYRSYAHLIGDPDKGEILSPADFKDWEFQTGVQFLQPLLFLTRRAGRIGHRLARKGTARGFAVYA